MPILPRVQMIGRSLARKYFPRGSPPPLDHDPYDKDRSELRASKMLAETRLEAGRTPLETCQRILEIIEESYPTKDLADEYFLNLDAVMSSLPRLEKPGQLVIGLGPGRCGSTSLAAMLGTVANSCCTHETPPLVSWKPQSGQIEFHVQRFRTLCDRFSLVSDVSHWWLNSIEPMLGHFPESKFIGLIRDPDDCAVSFMSIQGFGKGSFNPWAMAGNGVWRAGRWDATYPSYPSPSYAEKDPDRAKLRLITRYVEEYNAQLEAMARRAPDRIKLVRTQDLSKNSVQNQIFDFAKGQGENGAWKLNVNKTIDGKRIQIKF